MATNQSHQLGWKGPTKFRHLPVSFVKGEQYEPSVLAECHPNRPDGVAEGMVTASKTAVTPPVDHGPVPMGIPLEQANPDGPDRGGGNIDEPFPSMIQTMIQENIEQVRLLSYTETWTHYDVL